jgi:hypothetical protein
VCLSYDEIVSENEGLFFGEEEKASDAESAEVSA